MQMGARQMAPRHAAPSRTEHKGLLTTRGLRSAHARLKRRMRRFLPAAGAAIWLAVGFAAYAASADEPIPPGISDGVVTVPSAYSFSETIDRIKQAVSSKGITYFGTLEQSKLGAAAGVQVRPSVLLVFGNPVLSAQFLGGNPLAGLDWPVRLVVLEDAQGQVWTAYSDFAWIARRHHVTNRDGAFAMASRVIASINDSIRTKQQAR